ncbi:DUF1707 domain-containing protein [Nocardiopsis sp. RSe5-2]|uniref:DUF1707 domain-containing protein n=1 Tax=Nocardiopsis endophytica TaxID=3018445 RepID=A0ABT4UC46_9ACTN|nr:DUF1707 domain-containing protein [Nocardiopsis endophytica]MDA2814559.1 DUF1707 domain-containing protein [Nocardiopsis endophytica]
MEGSAARPGDYRAADSDRDAVAERLAAALAEGRLKEDEYRERLDAALSAVTLGDLEPLTADLPPAGAPAPAPRPEGPIDLAAASAAHAPFPWKEQADAWRSWAGGAVIMVGIWGLTSVLAGELTAFWPIIPLGIWALVVIAGMISGRRGC